jgi:hypothetical protein
MEALWWRSLTIGEAVPGRKDPWFAVVLGEIGKLHYNRGDYSGAQSPFREWLSILGTSQSMDRLDADLVLGGRHPRVGASHTMLTRMRATETPWRPLALSFVLRLMGLGLYVAAEYSYLCALVIDGVGGQTGSAQRVARLGKLGFLFGLRFPWSLSSALNSGRGLAEGFSVNARYSVYPLLVYRRGSRGLGLGHDG